MERGNIVSVIVVLHQSSLCLLVWDCSANLRIKFLGVPDSLPNVGHLLFKSASFLAAFPFIHTLAPAPLTIEGLVKALAFYTQKYKGLLNENYNVVRLLFLSLATFEKSDPGNKSDANQKDDKEIVDDEEDDLIVYTMEDVDSWDEFTAVKNFDNVSMEEYYIPADHLRELFTFLLAVMQFNAPDDISQYAQTHFTTKAIRQYSAAADALMATIGPKPKVSYAAFQAAFTFSFPHILEPLGRFFGQLLYAGDFGKHGNTATDGKEPKSKGQLDSEIVQETSELLSESTLAKLASVLGKNELVGRLVKLYIGAEAGYSLQAFETRVFKWSSASLLILSGSIISPAESGNDSRRKAFDNLISPSRTYKHSDPKSYPSKAIFAVLVDTPWKSHAKNSFGGRLCQIIQLAPALDVYASSALRSNYVYFSRSGASVIGFGGTPPKTVAGHTQFDIENVSLTIDGGLEFATFRHLGAGGSYHVSQTHPDNEFEYRMRIDDLEVWGYGGAAELEEQKKQWEWEEREAEYRRSVNVQSYGEGRALLEMAGLVGNHNASGGSM